MPRVSMPECEVCGTTDKVYPCARCGKLTCVECKFILPDDTCEHREPELGKSNPDWKLYDD